MGDETMRPYTGYTEPKWWPDLPLAGNIVWCRFPQTDGKVSLKSRPGLVLQVRASQRLSPGLKAVESAGKDENSSMAQATPCRILIAYGSSQHLDRIYPWEVVIDKGQSTGLALDTKFNLARCMIIPYTNSWFTRAPGRNAQSPIMGHINTRHEHEIVNVFRFLMDQGVDLESSFPEIESELVVDHERVGKDWNYQSRIRPPI